MLYTVHITNYYDKPTNIHTTHNCLLCFINVTPTFFGGQATIVMGYHILQLSYASEIWAISYVTKVLSFLVVYTVTKIVLSGLTYTTKKLETLVTYEKARSLDAYGNCSMWYPLTMLAWPPKNIGVTLIKYNRQLWVVCIFVGLSW
jgi:hypothetical protein